MRGAALDSLSDLLEMWGYLPLKIEAVHTIQAVLYAEKAALIIFQFFEFSEDEYELLRSIRRKAPSVPVLATSPFISVRDTFRMVRGGVEDYIRQPIHPLDLKKTVDKYFYNQSCIKTEKDI